MKMLKILLTEKGSLFVIALNVIVMLSILLFSMSFNSLTRFRLLNRETKLFQARLNAESGILLALKELKEGIISIPTQKRFQLFDNTNYQALVTLDHVIVENNNKEMAIQPGKTGDTVRIVSVGRFGKYTWKIIRLIKSGRLLLNYSQ